MILGTCARITVSAFGPSRNVAYGQNASVNAWHHVSFFVVLALITLGWMNMHSSLMAPTLSFSRGVTVIKSKASPKTDNKADLATLLPDGVSVELGEFDFGKLG